MTASEADAFVRKLRGKAYITGFSWSFFSDWIGAVCGLVTNDIKKLKTHADKYTHDGGKFMAELMNDYVTLAEKYPFHDVLGVLYQAAEEAMKYHGQFFTPSCISEMMARMEFNEDHFRSIVTANGKVKVLDPCCGSGAMLLANGKIVYEKLGTWGLNHVKYYGMDIDQTCVDMTRIQLRLNRLDQFGTLLRLSGSLESMASVAEIKLQLQQTPKGNFWFF